MMSNTSFVHPAILEENMIRINSFLKESYNEAKKHLEGGLSILQHSSSFFKQEFASFYYGTGQCINRIILPVNNFIKDINQIDAELFDELTNESQFCLKIEGKMVPAEVVLNMPMEENL